jgi:hypothetical protein
VARRAETFRDRAAFRRGRRREGAGRDLKEYGTIAVAGDAARKRNN